MLGDQVHAHCAAQAVETWSQTRGRTETVLPSWWGDGRESELTVVRSLAKALRLLCQTSVRQSAVTLLLHFPLSLAHLLQLFCSDDDFQLPRVGLLALLQADVLSSFLV